MKSLLENDSDGVQRKPVSFLLNGGMMSALLEDMDWADSPLGPPQSWPASLKMIMATILPAQAQIVLFWGEQFVALYNDAYAPTIGGKHPRALGRPAMENWLELWDDLGPLLRGVRETGETFSAKDRPFYIERRGLGETAYFDVSYSPVRDANGDVGGVLCIVTETTERVQFQRRQAFLLELGQALPTLSEAEEIEAYAICKLGKELGAARVFFGEDNSDGASFKVRQDWVDGMPSVVGEHRYQDFGHDLLTSLREGRSVHRGYASSGVDLTSTLHVPILRAGGLEGMLAVHFQPPHVFVEDVRELVEETAKRIWSAIIHARAERALRIDVTARINAEAELLAINENLEARAAAMFAQREAAMQQLHEARKMEMVGQLTGGIAHDFNNMLTPIIASLELIRRRQEDERSTRLIDGALLSADRARVLVGRLLSFARRQTLKPQAVALAALVNDMQELMSRSIGPTIELVNLIDPALPAVVVDPHQLELAILNLVVNARDAMAEGGRLLLRAGEERRHDGRQGPLAEGRYVWLQVSDSGSGMDEEVLKRCIEPFYSTKTVGKGTGLGLPMVQGLALQSGGGFSIHSRAGEGTEATIWLPISEVLAPSPGSDGYEVGVAPGANQVLLVDDEEIVRHTTALQLRDLGYEVTEAADAAQALQLIEDGLRPDALVTDHIMAIKTGVQFAQELRERFPELPVLIITGYANLTPRELRGFEVLRKPFRRAELAKSLAHLLSRREAEASD
uniref:ATP-binding protein n=1 Tax=Pseudomonas fluorescens TaxID=294 RepID=UPI00130EA56D|nr:ATP-binding protein [Pseudomonas fluorescens]